MTQNASSCATTTPARFPKSATFPQHIVTSKIMGPNPLKLEEELLTNHLIPDGSLV